MMHQEREPHRKQPVWQRGDRVRLPDGRTGKVLLTNQHAASVDPDAGGHVVYVHVAEAMTRLTPEAEAKDWLY